MTRLGVLVVGLALTGCGIQECVIDVAHRDCPAPLRPVASTFPQDDASCRSYGLAPGTSDYAKCRATKAHVGRLTRDESDYSFLRNPILPDVH